MPRRIPRARLATTFSQGFASCAAMPAGVRFVVRTDAAEVALWLNVTADSAPLDVRESGNWIHQERPEALTSELETWLCGLPPAAR
ncbi:hypothetical protein ACWERV_27525 [Streptomyces sp. NPDC004031]